MEKDKILELLECRKLIMKALLIYEGKDDCDEMIDLYRPEITKFLVYTKFPNKGRKHDQLREFLKKIPDKKHGEFYRNEINKKIFEIFKKYEGIIVLTFNKQSHYKNYINNNEDFKKGSRIKNSWSEIINPYEYFVFCVMRTNIEKNPVLNTSIGTFARQYMFATLVEVLNVSTEMFKLIYSLDMKLGHKWEEIDREEVRKFITIENGFTSRQEQLALTKLRRLTELKRLLTNSKSYDDDIDLYAQVFNRKID